MKKQFNVTQILPLSVLAMALVTGLILKLEIDNKNDIKTLISNQEAQNDYVQCQFRHLDSPKIVKTMSFDLDSTDVPVFDLFLSLTRNGAMSTFETSRAYRASLNYNQVLQTIVSTQTNFDFSACDKMLVQRSIGQVVLSAGGQLSDYLK